MKRYIIPTLLTAAAIFGAVSCIDDAELLNVYELGVVKDTVEVSSDAGSIRMNYYSNLSGTISIIGDVEWAALNRNTFSSDGDCLLSYDNNEGFCRMARVEFVTSGNERRDTVVVLQAGKIQEAIKFDNASASIFNSEDAETNVTRIPISINMDFKDISIAERYDSDDEWIRAIEYDDDSNTLSITTDNNTGDEVRTASLQFSFVNGWNKKVRTTLILLQANAANTLGTEETFSQVRTRGVVGEEVIIDDDIFISGYVVSSKASGNVGENENITNATIDYTGCERTTYLESLDGKYGFCIITDKVEDNTLDRWQKVSIRIKGATLIKRDNPERYEISHVTAASILSNEKVSSTKIPAKEKHISELTDDDIYTYVKLKDCELPVRKGSLTPLNDRFTNAGENNNVSKWPTLVRDIEGSSLYMYTNTTCPYRRDGRQLPYGSGDISGVIVHEKYRGFIDNDAEDPDDCGTIGTYQIRHMSWDEIDLQSDQSNGFSTILAEYTHYYGTSNGVAISPTAGTDMSGKLRHTYANSAKIYQASSYCYLGKTGTGAGTFYGNYSKSTSGGLGIIDASKPNLKDDLVTAGIEINQSGRGKVAAKAHCGWACNYWWDATTGTPHSWQIEFSTAGISTDMLSLQIAGVNAADGTPTYTGPRYWKVEWCDTENGTYEEIARYVLPQIVPQGNGRYQQNQSAGTKAMDFKLPLTMLGKSKVYIRLTPAENKRGDESMLTDDRTYYDNLEIIPDGEKILETDNTNISSLDYVAIRYNK